MDDNQLKKYRQELHQIPEIAFDLFLTHEYVKSELIKMGYEIEVVAKTGIIASKKGLSKEAIAYRSDMDALPVDEKTNVSFASKHPQKMHACGHDGHMSMLLGFASYVASLANLRKTVVFIFQPAEEGGAGGKMMREQGVLQNPKVEQIYALHVAGTMPMDTLASREGTLLAGTSTVKIIVKGNGGRVIGYTAVGEWTLYTVIVETDQVYYWTADGCGHGPASPRIESLLIT